MPLINDTNKQMASPEAPGQLGDVIKCLIKAMTKAPNGKLLFVKKDIKDGYWQVSVERREEWNFAYIFLPTPECEKNYQS